MNVNTQLHLSLGSTYSKGLASKLPVLVILHGLFGSLDNFQSVATHFDRSLPVVRIDLPGHGESDTLPQLSIEAMAEAVFDTIQSLNVTRFHLLGHSLGGKVAMAMAGQNYKNTPERLIVVDIAPKAYPPHHAGILEALTAIDLATLSNRNHAERQLRTAIPDAGVRAFLLKSLYRKDGQYSWRFDLPKLARDYPLLCKAPVMQKQVNIPTLFIKGGNSDYLTRADEPLVKRHFSAPQLKEIGGAGHWPHAEKPAVFTRLCLDFLQ